MAFVGCAVRRCLTRNRRKRVFSLFGLRRTDDDDREIITHDTDTLTTHANMFQVGVEKKTILTYFKHSIHKLRWNNNGNENKIVITEMNIYSAIHTHTKQTTYTLFSFFCILLLLLLLLLVVTMLLSLFPKLYSH